MLLANVRCTNMSNSRCCLHDTTHLTTAIDRYDLLEDGYHYVSFEADLSNVVEKTRDAVTTSKYAHTPLNGLTFVKTYLSQKSQTIYAAQLLQQYAEMLKPPWLQGQEDKAEQSNEESSSDSSVECLHMCVHTTERRCECTRDEGQRPVKMC